ncbi:MAG: cbb3-type cytochrome c oxidase subunit I, partial [Ignavibacteriota bacterium]
MEASSIASAYSPPIKIVAKYFITAIVSFVILNFLLMISYPIISGHHFQPRILAITHVATLGWISTIIFGAWFQLIPVVLEVKLFSEKLAEIQFWIYLLGVIGLVYGFWFFETGNYFIGSAILLNLAMFIFAFNIVATLTKVKKWNLTGLYLAAAIFHLVVTAIAGLLLAINLAHPYIKLDHLQYLNLHVHIAFIGWVSMVVMGVTYKLIPMFTLSHGFSLTNGKWAFWLINIGLLGISTVMHYKNTTIFFYIFSGMITVGIIFFLLQVHIIFKKRIRKKFDTGIQFSFTAYLMLGITTALGTFMAFGNASSIINLTLVYGYLIVFGYLSMLIVGQMYKIVPFLVWYHKYSSKVGLEKVPLIKDMFNENYAGYGFYIMLTAVIGTVASLLLKSETGLLIS